MYKLLGASIFFVGSTTAAMAAEATQQTINDALPVRGSIIANLLQDHDNPFTLYTYDTNYLLYTDTSSINKQAIKSYDWSDHARNDEIAFQFSLAFPLWRGIAGDNSVLAASYTQDSWWQASNTRESSPFRETNYEPQVFLGWATDDEFAGWTLRDVEVGVNHQSNGKADPTSRSWDRLYSRLMAQNGDWQVELTPWVTVGSLDDNPDITKYMGYYLLKVGYAWGPSVFSVQTRYNWNSGYGSGQVGWSYPITKHVRFYTQLFSGYGESMIDYNHRQTRIGMGVMLNDMM